MVVEPHQRVRGRRHREPIAVASEQFKPIELRQRVVDLEIDVDRELVRKPFLDALVELRLGQRRG
jgi:hypothetical protein